MHDTLGIGNGGGFELSGMVLLCGNCGERTLGLEDTNGN